MRKIWMILAAVWILAIPVRAMEFTPPQPPPDALMPVHTETFEEGLAELVEQAVSFLSPALKEGCSSCLQILTVILLLSILHSIQELPGYATDLVGTLVISGILLGAVHSLVILAGDTVQQLSQYGKLLLPVMTAAMAAQGGINQSAVLYAGSAFFLSILTAIVAKLLIPLAYVLLAVSVAGNALQEEKLKKLRDLLKSVCVWCLKTVLYVFTGYVTITGVVSGNTDAMALKTAKLTISSMVPVIGGMLSDATESVLVSAGIMKNAAGIYGMLAILGICLVPFLRISVQYLLLKLTDAICSMIYSGKPGKLIGDISAVMGLLMGMTGSVCFMLLISTACFLKGVGL